MPDNLFLDTEWNNDAARELVSLALIHEDGLRRFYAERLPRPEAPSSFVRAVVYPLLEGPVLSDQEFGAQLRAFIASFDHPRIHFDGAIDQRQLARALTGFGTWNGGIPAWEPVLVTRLDVLDKQEQYFASRPDQVARRHHAAVDAEALRHAWVGVVRIDS
jgi:3' exoribonuclease, RNase T-like